MVYNQQEDDSHSKKESSNFNLDSDDDANDAKSLNSFGCTCKATVLIVDDNPFNLIPLRMNLKLKHKLHCLEGEDGL